MPWIFNWYENKAVGRPPDPAKDKGRFLKSTFHPTFSVRINTTKLTGTNNCIMEGYGIFPNPPSDKIGVSVITGVRLWLGPYLILDEWYFGGYSGSVTVNPPATAYPIWRIQYHNRETYLSQLLGGSLVLSRTLP